MKDWLRRFRGFLVVLPIALVVGFGFDGYTMLKGDESGPRDAVDVDKGETAELGPATMRLMSLEKKKPTSSSVDAAPKGAVVMVARFRGRIDDAAQAKKQKFTFCESHIENGEGWRWESTTISPPLYPKNASTSCDGKRMNSDFKDVKPAEGKWYDFYVGYYVPKGKAEDLRPALAFGDELPRYLRFEA